MREALSAALETAALGRWRTLLKSRSSVLPALFMRPAGRLVECLEKRAYRGSLFRRARTFMLPRRRPSFDYGAGDGWVGSTSE